MKMEKQYTPFHEKPEILKNLNVGNSLKHILHIISTSGGSKLRCAYNAPFLLDAFTCGYKSRAILLLIHKDRNGEG